MATLIGLPASLKIAGFIGVAQTVALAAYALSIVGFELGGATSGIHGSDLAPGVLVALYFVFAALIAIATYALVQRKRSALTPFLLIQAFGVVIAEPLLSGSGTALIGVVIVAVSVVAAVACILPPSRAVLQ